MRHPQLEYQWQDPATLTNEESKYQEHCEKAKLGFRFDPFDFNRFGGISKNPTKENIQNYQFFLQLMQGAVGELTYTQYLRKFLNARIITGL